MNRPEFIELRFTVEFQWKLKRIDKKYRSIQADLERLLEQLKTGTLVGDQITNIGYTVFKARVQNRDIQKGKAVDIV